MRLDKFLVDCGLGSRTEIKALLRKKLIVVNGKTETLPKLQIDENKDKVAFGDQLLEREVFVYYLLNKPKGVISATVDDEQRTVLDLLDSTAVHKNVFPVGRLDKDTTGLLLLTNNGALAHALLSPKKHVDKLYEAEISGVMDEADKKAFSDGIALKDYICQPAQLELLSADQGQQICRVRIKISEGKFHQIKRMVAARGKEVTALKRLCMGPLHLPDDLAEGQWRRLNTEEIKCLAVFGVSL